MKKILLNIVATLAMIFSLAFVSKPVFAGGACSGGIKDSGCNPVCYSDIDDDAKRAAGCEVDATDTLPSHLNSIINVAISVVGILAVLVIVMGGQRYITSAGDPGKIKAAKDMIVYAVVALIVAGLAYAVVNFVAQGIGK